MSSYSKYLYKISSMRCILFLIFYFSAVSVTAGIRHEHVRFFLQSNAVEDVIKAIQEYMPFKMECIQQLDVYQSIKDLNDSLKAGHIGSLFDQQSSYGSDNRAFYLMILISLVEKYKLIEYNEILTDVQNIRWSIVDVMVYILSINSLSKLSEHIKGYMTQEKFVAAKYYSHFTGEKLSLPKMYSGDSTGKLTKKIIFGNNLYYIEFISSGGDSRCESVRQAMKLPKHNDNGLYEAQNKHIRDVMDERHVSLDVSSIPVDIMVALSPDDTFFDIAIYLTEVGKDKFEESSHCDEGMIILSSKTQVDECATVGYFLKNVGKPLLRSCRFKATSSKGVGSKAREIYPFSATKADECYRKLASSQYGIDISDNISNYTSLLVYTTHGRCSTEDMNVSADTSRVSEKCNIVDVVCSDNITSGVESLRIYLYVEKDYMKDECKNVDSERKMLDLWRKLNDK